MTRGRSNCRETGRLSPADTCRPLRLAVSGRWDEVLRPGPALAELEKALPEILASRRWFAGKARSIRSVTIFDAVPVSNGPAASQIALFTVRYARGSPETYTLPLGYATGKKAGEILASRPEAAIAILRAKGKAGLLVAAESDPSFAWQLFRTIDRALSFAGRSGTVRAWPVSKVKTLVPAGAKELAPSLLSGEQSNSSIRFGERFVLKLFRKVEAGPNPEIEIGAFLTSEARFSHVPPLHGGIEYRPKRGEPLALAVLQGFVPNRGDAWRYTLGELRGFFERVTAGGMDRRSAPVPTTPLLELADADPPARVCALLGPFLGAAALLGQRTGELHLALASRPGSGPFAPEPFLHTDRRLFCRSLEHLAKDALHLLGQRLPSLSGDDRTRALEVLDQGGRLARRFRRIVDRPLTSLRTRIHGDYHLGQVLFTGHDFVVIDFEGEPGRSIAARRAKSSPVRDVAGMLRSFHYAAYQGLADRMASGAVPVRRRASVESWARLWQVWVSAAFLRSWLITLKGAPLLPGSRAELRDLFEIHLVEKALYELVYEINNRPDWIGLPLQGIADLLGQTGRRASIARGDHK